MRTKFRDHRLLDDAGQQWREFSSTPAKSRLREDATFQPFGRIVSSILAEVPNSGVSYLANPNGTPLSERNNTSRPDGYLVVRNANPSMTTHWFDIAMPFEFKKTLGVNTLRDDEEKMIWSLHNIMREDPCRRFAFGISIEDTQLRLWLSNRALLVVSEPINLKDIDVVISLFYALGSASTTDTKEGLGWDPTVERILAGEEYRYQFTVGNEVFTTTRELATYGADSMVGRATRVYEATDAEGKRVVVKDSWREANRQSEGDILAEILASCRKELPADQVADAEKHFVRIRLCKSVEISGVTDETLNPMAGDEGSTTWKWIPIDFPPALPGTRHPNNTGDVLDSRQLSASLPAQKPGIVRRQSNNIPRRVHVRTVFWDIGVPIKDINVLADSLSCLHDGLKALYYLHKAGWVYRDFSVGNVIWVDDDDRSVGKLNDFEYATKVDSEYDVDHDDVRTGTMHFMAMEVEEQQYLFRPGGISLLADYESLGASFRMNLLHDIESVWWAFAWVLFYHTEEHRGNTDLEAQQTSFQQAFPGAVGQTSRRDFFTNPSVFGSAYNSLSDACKVVCYELGKFADSLQESYRDAEKLYPVLRIDNTILERIHGEALSCLDSGRNKASGIKLYPFHELLRNKKRVRPEGEGSATSPSGKKRGRQG